MFRADCVRGYLLSCAIPRRRMRVAALLAWGVLVASCLSAVAACSAEERSFTVGVHFVLDRGTPLADRERPLIVCNLVPYQHVRLTALLWIKDTYFSSQADFYVTDDELNTGKLAPRSGSYFGIQADGYLWSMRPDPDPPADLRRLSNQDTSTIVVGIETEKGQRLSAQIARNFGLAQVQARALRRDGLVGTLFVPGSAVPRRAAVLVLPGTDPPMFEERMGYLLASRGHAVLRLDYVGAGDVPAQLRSVPIEYFSRAVDVMRRELAVAAGKIVVLAFARATEAAALLALQRDDITRLVLVAPSSVVNAAEARGDLVEAAAWIRDGAPVAFMRGFDGEDELMADQQAPYRMRPRYEARLAALAADDPARIPFERITSEVVLIACDADDVWPSARMANDIVERARRDGRDSVTAHILSGCGHDLAAPIAPTTAREYVASNGVRFALGGIPQSVWFGQRAAWDLILHAISAR
jgi:BAAT / Acyl-CoA thioester hydrolase C terminal/Acyl-CoA thioester hydrolase/BAAT N-terminal region